MKSTTNELACRQNIQLVNDIADLKLLTTFSTYFRFQCSLKNDHQIHVLYLLFFTDFSFWKPLYFLTYLSNSTGIRDGLDFGHSARTPSNSCARCDMLTLLIMWLIMAFIFTCKRTLHVRFNQMLKCCSSKAREIRVFAAVITKAHSPLNNGV